MAKITPHQIGVLAVIGMVCFFVAVFMWPVYVAGLILFSALIASCVGVITSTYGLAKTLAETSRHKE